MSSRTRRWSGLFVLVVGLTGTSASCSSKSAPDAGATTPPVTAGPAADVVEGADTGAGTAPTIVDDVVTEVAEPTRDELTKKLEALAALEIAGMTKSRGQVQGELVTLQLDSAPNGNGISGSVELTVSACAGCAAPTVAELEGRKEMLLGQLGELHAKNPGLVFEVKALELAPARQASIVYARSYVDDGTTRASVHTLEVHFADNGFIMRFQAYPRSGFPRSADELASAYTQAELEGAVRQVFGAAAAILWPPAAPE